MHGRFPSAGFMNRIVSADDDRGNRFRDMYIGKATGKGLLPDVRMQQHPGAENESIRCYDLPSVGEMVPSLVLVGDRDLKIIEFGPNFLRFDTYHVRLSGKYKYGKGQKIEENDHVKYHAHLLLLR